jgi:hypothetical protein
MRTLVSILLLFLTNCAKHSSITTITEFSSVPDKVITPESLIFTDIDNTIMRASTHYGSVEFSEHLFNEEFKKNSHTKAQIMLKLAPEWKKGQELVPTTLIDEKVHSFIDRVNARKSHVIAFTARQPNIAQLTYNQLAKHNIFLNDFPNFSFHLAYRVKIFPDEKWCQHNHCSDAIKTQHKDIPSIFYKGILFANDLNTKGKVFSDFINYYISYAQSNNLPAPKTVVLIDDKMYNLQSMKEAAATMNLNFYGYHIPSIFPINLKIALEEEQILLSIYDMDDSGQ